MTTMIALLLTFAPAQDTASFIARDVRFASGAMLPEVRIHYRTVGRLRQDASGSNAVLLLHGTGGSGQGFLARNFGGELFGPGRPLDTARTFIIIPDNVGHGRSSKPSDGLRAGFPEYAYADMVALQHRLVTEGLGVRRLKAIMGTSMGCMHTWLWAERWPDAMDAIVPLACFPTAITGRNRMWRRLVIDAIRNSPDWNGGNYTAPPSGMLAAMYFLWFVGTTPHLQHAQGPTPDSADAFIRAWVADRLRTYDANDFMYAVAASRDYDPSCCLEQIRARVLAINTADDELNPPELGIMERLMPRVRNGRHVLIATSPLTRGHGSHSWPALWMPHLEEFLSAR